MDAFVWDRTVGWRQGAIIPNDGAIVVDPELVLVVISHDCDCVNDPDKEPALEVIPAKRIQILEAEFCNGRNPRKLHLPIVINGNQEAIELAIHDRIPVPKQKLVSLKPSADFQITSDAIRQLGLWLASRYLRLAVPESLAKRLSRVERHFKKAGEKAPQAILGIYIDYEPKGELDEPSEPYEFHIAVVYDSSQADAQAVATEVARNLQSAFERAYRKVGSEPGLGWELIELRSCLAASDVRFTLQDVMTYGKYRLEYISFKTGDLDAITPNE